MLYLPKYPIIALRSASLRSSINMKIPLSTNNRRGGGSLRVGLPLSLHQPAIPELHNWDMVIYGLGNPRKTISKNAYYSSIMLNVKEMVIDVINSAHI